LSREILRLFLEVNLRGTTVVLATHDRDTIQRVGRRVLTLDRGRLVSDTVIAGTEPPELEPPAELEPPTELDRSSDREPPAEMDRSLCEERPAEPGLAQKLDQ